MSDENKLSTDIPPENLFLMELLIRVSALEKLIIEKNIVSLDELVQTNMAEGKRLTDALSLEVQKLEESLVKSK